MGQESEYRARGREQIRQAASDFAARPSRERESHKASKVVSLWNARLERGLAPLFVPTIGAAIEAGKPWLSFWCPGCGQVGDVDLRKLDRHPDATVEALIPALSCRRCAPHPPFAKLSGLFERPGKRVA
jgi:hypothetical protein